MSSDYTNMQLDLLVSVMLQKPTASRVGGGSGGGGGREFHTHNLAIPGRLLTYPPSRSKCPSWGSQIGGMYPERDMEARTYRHVLPATPMAT